MPDVEIDLLNALVAFSGGDNATASTSDTQRLVIPYPLPGKTADPEDFAMARDFTDLCVVKAIRDKAPNKTLTPDRIAGYYDDLAKDARSARKLSDIAARQNTAGFTPQAVKGTALTEYLKEQLNLSLGAGAANRGFDAVVDAQREFGKWQAVSFNELHVTKLICRTLAQTRKELFKGDGTKDTDVMHAIELVQSKAANGKKLPEVAAFIASIGANQKDLQERVIRGTTDLDAAEQEKADFETKKKQEKPEKPDRKAPERGRPHHT